MRQARDMGDRRHVQTLVGHRDSHQTAEGARRVDFFEFGDVARRQSRIVRGGDGALHALISQMLQILLGVLDVGDDRQHLGARMRLAVTIPMRGALVQQMKTEFGFQSRINRLVGVFARRADARAVSFAVVPNPRRLAVH